LPPSATRKLCYREILRWTAVVAGCGWLVLRLTMPPRHPPMLHTRPEAVVTGHLLPEEVRQRLESVEWNQRVGNQLGLWVSIHWQRLLGIEAGMVQFMYPCSTAARGAGNREGSNQTPLGWHAIEEKIGDALPSGAVLVERQFTGRVWTGGTPTDKDYVLTRLLWLRGLEPGINAGPGIDSHDRYIYIHGTPAEDKIGTPASMGCVRMRNDHVIELFDRVPRGTPVLITEW
jgi:hypothetical protein